VKNDIEKVRAVNTTLRDSNGWLNYTLIALVHVTVTRNHEPNKLLILYFFFQAIDKVFFSYVVVGSTKSPPLEP